MFWYIYLQWTSRQSCLTQLWESTIRQVACALEAMQWGTVLPLTLFHCLHPFCTLSIDTSVMWSGTTRRQRRNRPSCGFATSMRDTHGCCEKSRIALKPRVRWPRSRCCSSGTWTWTTRWASPENVCRWVQLKYLELSQRWSLAWPSRRKRRNRERRILGRHPVVGVQPYPPRKEHDPRACVRIEIDNTKRRSRTNNIAAAICTWLSGPKIVTRSDADSLSGNRTFEFVFVSMSWMKMHFSPRRVRWYLRGIETLSLI